jgi:DNA/RNA endonuclease YhcR with UshA esterase domain
MKLKHLSILFSIAGILILYLMPKPSEPSIIWISEIPNYEGKQVSVIGAVSKIFLTKYGSQMITIKDNNSATTVFVEGQIDVEYGDKIQVTGQVQKYNGDFEIVVNDNSFVKILEKWHNISLPLWQLAQTPTKYLGLNVNVTGYIESISNSHFYLTDTEGDYNLIVSYLLAKNITILPGQKISASGKFLFDEKTFRYKLEIYDEKHGITFLNKR